MSTHTHALAQDLSTGEDVWVPFTPEPVARAVRPQLKGRRQVAKQYRPAPAADPAPRPPETHPEYEGMLAAARARLQAEQPEPADFHYPTVGSRLTAAGILFTCWLSGLCAIGYGLEAL